MFKGEQTEKFIKTKDASWLSGLKKEKKEFDLTG